MHVLRLLGTVDISDGDGGWTRAGPAKQSCVLATLALSPGEPVAVPELIARVWGTDAPVSAPNVLYGHMTRLRALLRGSGDDSVQLARSRDDGYRLDIEAERVDVFAMCALASRAQERQDAADHRGAAELWRSACELWRGPALLGLDGDWARNTRQELQREHASVLSGRFETELALGNHAAIVRDLYQAVGRNPTTESLVGHLMVALYRCDRPAEALACFEEARVRLRDALGTEPALRLRELHRQILRHDPALRLPEPAAGPGGAAIATADTVPLMQLPAATSVFTGRTETVTRLCELVTRPRDAPQSGTVAVTAIDGMAGIGKTTLAVHVAHTLAADFPDGRLFIDLHGFTADMEPTAPADALERMLRALGVPPARIPADTDDRAAVYRGALAGKRVLIVLDNAVDEAQVRQLLPGSPGAAVLITSRHRLWGLDDAHPVSLDVLDTGEAVDLFQRIAGSPGPDDHDRVHRIVELCGRLPLAVRIAAARFRSRPHWTLADLLDRLDTEHGPLTELDAGQRGVTTAFQASYRDLDPERRRVFRLLSLAPGPDFGVHAAAALLDLPLPGTERHLEDLLDAHLLRATATGRYRFHDLLRRYAATASEAEDPAADRRAAVVRLLDLFRHTAGVAGELIAPNTSLATAPAPSTPVVRFPDRSAAVRWFATERPHLTDAVDLAAATGHDSAAWQIAAGLCSYLDRNGSYRDIVAVAERGTAAARRAKAAPAEAKLLNQLGGAFRMTNRFGDAADRYRQALRIRRDGGDHRGEAMAHNGLGLLRQRQGRFAESIEHFLEAMSLVPPGDGLTAMILNNLGVPLNHLGRAEEALRHYRTALDIYRTLGQEGGTATATHNIGESLWHLGDFDAALTHHLRATEYFDRTRAPHLLAIATNALGRDLRSLGRLDEAADSHNRALRTFRHMRDRHNEGNALVELGRASLTGGRLTEAFTYFTEAAEVSAAVESPYQEARAHHGLADVLVRRGDTTRARPHLDRALARYTECGTPEAGELRNRSADA